EAVHKELGDSLVRAATSASSLEAEQDSGNINKTQSKATPNESSSQGTNLGGGPRFQETIGDTIAQTRVLDLEKTKTTQDNEIASLKRRIKKLEKKNRIDAIDANKEITMVSIQNVDEEMFDVNVLDGKEVFVAEQEIAANKENDEVNVVEEVVEVINTAKLIIDVAQVSAAGNVVSTAGDATTVSASTTTTDDDGDITLA
ncbi:hypothetical protein Tco_1045921, partial [Tanacetum coccineum]